MTMLSANGKILARSASSGGGKNIYPTIADAIANASNIKVGSFFETNGFHTSGDMGGARYLVTDSGTANGMDIIQLTAGKYAVLQLRLEGFPEQLGYDRFAQSDLTPYLDRMAQLNIRHIKLRDCGSDNYPYLMKTTWNVNYESINIEGVYDFSTGYAPRIWFVPSSYGAEVTPMFNLTRRDFRMSKVVLMNRPWFTESNTHNCVCILMAVRNTNNMWYEFDHLAIQGFSIGIFNRSALDGSGDGLQWHCVFRSLAMALNTKNVYLKGLTYITKFDNCFFTVNTSGAESICLEESFTVEFDRCNFGMYNPASTIVKLNKFVVPGAPVKMRYSGVKFTSCNFEIESDSNHPLPTNNKGYFFKIDDDDEFHVEIDNCFFISTPLARNDIYGCRAISLGNRTTMSIRNSCGSYADVKYSGNEFYEWDYCKRIFDETRPPNKAVNSVIIEHCTGIIPPPNNLWGSAFLPAVKTDEMTCPQCDDTTDFLNNYPNAKDGILLLNLDKANINAKIGGSIVQVTSPSSNKVRIGDRIYDYVVIDGRKWITTNLQLYTMGGRQWRFYDHQEFGFYYATSEFAEIDAMLPAGWRRPNQADLQSLINQGYAAIQKTGYTAWPNATNSSGFSATPNDYWRKPDVTPDFSRGFIWGPEESGVGWHNLWIRPTQLTYGGWTYAEAATVKCPLRVCCDA